MFVWELIQYFHAPIIPSSVCLALLEILKGAELAPVQSYSSILFCSEMKLDWWVFCTQLHLLSADATLWGDPVLQKEKIGRGRHVWTGNVLFLWRKFAWNNCVVVLSMPRGLLCLFFSFQLQNTEHCSVAACLFFFFFSFQNFFPFEENFLVVHFFSRTHLL